MKIKALCVLGTRPEAIKMAPLIKALHTSSMIINRVCVTGQHRQMLDGVLALFDILPDYNLAVMSHNQTLSELTSKILLGLSNLFDEWRPDVVFVHGDTTTCLVASLAAYYHKIPIAHIEAGLRTGDINLPWPEEANRKLTDALSTFYFAPTESARLNLLRESVCSKSIYVTGNTVIDALIHAINRLDNDEKLVNQIQVQYSFLSTSRKMILVTGHRRESFGEGFERICRALLTIAKLYPMVDIVYPVHLNPNVQEPVNRLLRGIENVYLVEPAEYSHFVYLMSKSYMILTDSGGVQEEASSIGKPVLVMRDTTERIEALEMGVVKLVGTEVDSIVRNVREMLTDEFLYQKMSQKISPYGDGKAAERIVQIIESHFKKIDDGVQKPQMEFSYAL